jgi:hypothetical protein
MVIPASGVRGMGMRRGEDKSKAAAILKTMPAIDVAASLAFFEEYGDFCDCKSYSMSCRITGPGGREATALARMDKPLSNDVPDVIR